MTPEEVFRRFERNPATFTRIPVATYRLQLGADFTFADARELVPYLAALGISDCHLSPVLQPCSAGSHGYDVADHGQLNVELGAEADYRALVETLQAHGMGQILDVVPNHMGIAGSRNAWWTDVLENGPASTYAAYFDIEWDPVKPELKNKVLLPILGNQYGHVLENQELRLEFQEGGFRVRYHDTLLPVAPRTYRLILGWRLDELELSLGAEHPHLTELRSILTALEHLPPQTERDPARLEERQREKEVAKRRLAALLAESPRLREFVDQTVQRYNGVKGQSRSFDRLDALLGEQAYRLSFWQVAGDEINYRRFFDINELAAIRMEEPAVFEGVHRLVFRLVREGAVTGLRIDHPDGLFAPIQYLRDLQRRCFLERARSLCGPGTREAQGEAADWDRAVLTDFDRRVAEQEARARAGREGAGARSGGLRRPWSVARRALQAMLGGPAATASPARAFYVVAEKILMADERLSASWPVAGTTGYEFLNTVNGLFVDRAGARSLTDTYARFIGARLDFAEVAYQAKRLVMDTSMASEITMLGHRLGRISERWRLARDFTDRMLTEALREIVACFPVYRTYAAAEPAQGAARDRRYIETAVAEARRRNPSVSASVFDFLQGLLCLELPTDTTEAELAEVRTFVGRFEQLTGPFTAKGLEDTAFYRYHRLVSLNEVGGRPDVFGVSPEEFHRRNLARLAEWPAALSALSTHDTKRGEDARARINVLSEMPREWRVRVRAWRRLNRPRKAMVDRERAPDRNDEYLLYQTLLGCWPASAEDHSDLVDRIQAYMLKAVREAKAHTSWITPRAEYEGALRAFVAALLDRSGPNEFLDAFLPFQARVAELGIYNSLSQTLLRLTAPGIPELYQGAELWELSLVDPDNRRPVAFDRRRALLADLQARMEAAGGDLTRLAGTLVDERADGRIKLYVLHRALTYRRQHPQLFLQGDYVPLEIGGARANHVCAFLRGRDGQEVVIAVPRLLASLSHDGPPLGGSAWGDDAVLLPSDGRPTTYRDLFTGSLVETRDREGRRALPLADVFAAFPVAMLERTQTA
ncbi:MAG TPA: malto-oligosyltrehalose synthase [Methylomirabilota bacterium]|nr:malto-oligosyltrehalose synthase [Methylomirabilota bacterium]